MDTLGINFNSNKIAIVDGKNEITYKDLGKNILKTLIFLKKKNIKKQTKILISIENSAEYIYLYFASILNNSIVVPINQRNYKKSKKKIINLVKPKLIIENINQIKQIYSYKKYKKQNTFNSKQVFSIFFSSGTEGEAKGIAHNYNALKLSAINFNKHNNIKDNTIFLQFLPMSYMAGFLNSVLCILLANGKIVINKEFNFKFLINFPKLIEKFKINTIWLTPSNLLLINELYSGIKNKLKILGSLKKIFVGTSPLLNKDKILFEKNFQKKLLNSYGLSEILFVSCSRNAKDKGVGKILNNQKIKINKKNEILVKNNTFFKFYYNNNKKYLPKLSNKFYNTGDLGYFDQNNNLFVTGRSKDIIIKAGENIYPSNIENLINNKKLFKEICIFGINDQVNGEEVAIAIVKKDKINNSRIYSHLKKKLTNFYFPKKIFYLKKLPKSLNGKIQKKKIN